MKIKPDSADRKQQARQRREAAAERLAHKANKNAQSPPSSSSTEHDPTTGGKSHANANANHASTDSATN